MRLRSASTLIAFGCLLAASLLAGCGGSAGSGADGALSKGEYIERSNALQHQASTVFADLNGHVATTPAQARRYLAAFDRLAAGLAKLDPPPTWADEHERMVADVRAMRQAMAIVSRASARNTRVIAAQLRRSSAAQRDFEDAVRSINATR